MYQSLGKHPENYTSHWLTACNKPSLICSHRRLLGKRQYIGHISHISKAVHPFHAYQNFYAFLVVQNKSAPIIITLEMEITYQEYFNAMRKKHFPAYANFLDAHITLFHKLPQRLPRLAEQLETFASRAAFKLSITGIKHMGTGVAFVIESKELKQLHKKMQASFKPWLISKDRLKLWPHITIQNKVTEYKSRLLYEELAASFVPFEVMATGFASWQYLKGPWKLVDEYSFSDEPGLVIKTT